MSQDQSDQNNIDFIADCLMKYGDDESVLCISELDGFFAAIVSGPDAALPSQWLPALWGGEDKQPAWESQQELERFVGLLITAMNNASTVLMQRPETYSAQFEVSSVDENITVVEEWCTGYMRGVAMGNWPELPDEIDTRLYAIALHGLDENNEVLDSMTLAEHQQTVADIEPAARKLHAYWLAQRTPSQPPQPLRSEKTGRNAPCPCGSGKKYKQCCLH